MTNWAQISTGLLFYAYDGIHQLRTQALPNVYSAFKLFDVF